MKLSSTGPGRIAFLTGVQAALMKTLLTSFLGSRQETIRPAICIYPASEVENIEERDFHTFRTRQLNVQVRYRDRGKHLSAAVTYTRTSSSTTYTHEPQTFQLKQSAISATEYILVIPETHMPATQVIQPAQRSQVVLRGQQKPKGPQTSCVVVNDQQPGTSRQLLFTISPSKVFNPLSVASVTDEESEHLRTVKHFRGIYRQL